MRRHIRPQKNRGVLVEVTPQQAGWRYLWFKAVRLETGEAYAEETAGHEVALVPLAGTARIEANGEQFLLERRSVFAELPHVLYLPPGTRYRIEAQTAFECALGGAPARGRYPLRCFKPEEMKVEIRGGANATRQVNHVLGPHLPAERLILFEVYTPSGFWSGWPPHRHDGRMGSAYLEETYYYKITPKHGFAIHRNYTKDTDLDECLLARDGDLILVPEGYHPVAAPPGSNVYYLNYLAGELLDEARATPPKDDPDWAWMREDWAGQPITIPIGKP
ncbi:5-deoxy-glucuronate isomerase [Marinithermus hydrothermalis]|uniref:Myo-inositol catabolism IolB domain protein n=1 Tax=Marinithermus hydrothermalis (strain DSM 14884 / JCM 11576 / T1) TaxID=869210 RepID=F2NQF9_MARHT|nr:5-deoxy-glucuronate isomerase [Marinithermus hydrothermalis]AEB11686.1 myo-inositol catabolism IolB domain protein [Marinithermus hydrothermalis DSM 14884]